jgi:two-component system sensor histidine kinase MtrB
VSAFWTRLRTFDYANLPRLVWHAWRRSLQLRTVIISVVLSLVAIIFVGVYLSWSISQDLFDSRLKQSLTDAARAQVVAQQIFDSADVVDRADVQSVVSQATAAIRDASSSSWLALYRTSGQDANPLAPQDFTSPELSGGIITADLRDSVREGVGRQYWQSVNIFAPEGNLPGIIVGSLTTIPGVGDYELYIGFDLSPAEATLAFIQQVLWIAGTGLLVLIGGIAWFVARLVVVPIRSAAAT